jgi:hypothetical protein
VPLVKGESKGPWFDPHRGQSFLFLEPSKINNNHVVPRGDRSTNLWILAWLGALGPGAPGCVVAKRSFNQEMLKNSQKINNNHFAPSGDRTTDLWILAWLGDTCPWCLPVVGLLNEVSSSLHYEMLKNSQK